MLLSFERLRLAINRTILELKLINTIGNTFAGLATNRTILELRDSENNTFILPQSKLTPEIKTILLKLYIFVEFIY